MHMPPALVAPVSATLAQLAGPDTAAVPPLPAAPLHEAWIFENPMPLTLVLVGLAIAVLMVFLRLGKARRALLIAGGVLLLGAGAFVAGRLVETPREVLKADSGRLVQATASADAATMRELLHPNVILRPGGVKFIPEITGRERLLGLAGDRIPRAIERVVVLETRAGLDGDGVGRTQVRLRTFGPGGRLYGHSWWALDWQEQDGRWVAIGIEPLWIQGG